NLRSPQEQIILAPSLARVDMEMTQLTQENTDFATRDRYHGSSICTVDPKLNMLVELVVFCQKLKTCLHTVIWTMEIFILVWNTKPNQSNFWPGSGLCSMDPI
ncbi:Solute carrier family 12 member 8, partial [Galemys pyrenaicus]